MPSVMPNMLLDGMPVCFSTLLACVSAKNCRRLLRVVALDVGDFEDARRDRADAAGKRHAVLADRLEKRANLETRITTDGAPEQHRRHHDVEHAGIVDERQRPERDVVLVEAEAPAERFDRAEILAVKFRNDFRQARSSRRRAAAA